MPFQCTSAYRWNWTHFLLSLFEKVRVTRVEILSYTFEAIEGLDRARPQQCLPLGTALRRSKPSLSAFLSPFLGQSLQGLSPLSHSSLRRLSIICCLALGLWYLKEDTYQAVRFCLNFPGSCLNFLLNFCFRDKLYSEGFPCASAVSAESLENLVINKDSWNPASGRNLYRMKYQLRHYLDVLLRPCLGSGFQKYIA